MIKMEQKYDIAAYIWPAYTGDEPRTHIFWDKGIGEWQSVMTAEKKFPEHNWPRKPLWGYVNEADPYVMEMEIEAAVSHGVNVFIYDWYWYDKRPFLEQCLDNGFLKARNRNKMKFYITWANHDASSFWDKRLTHEEEHCIWDGRVDRQEFEKIVNRFIDKYFSCENYYKIDGCPVFNIHFLQNLVKGLGGIDEAADALNYFREQTKKAGFPDLHLQLNLIGTTENYMGFDLFCDVNMKEAFSKIRFDSATHYQFLAFVDMNRDYADVIPDAVKEWEEQAKCLDFPYFPQVSIGWDNNPRANSKKFMPTICKNNTPENFEKALIEAKNFIDRHNLHPLITVNSWNEWTETSYLQPDDIFGYGYLEAVKHVFKPDGE